MAQFNTEDPPPGGLPWKGTSPIKTGDVEDSSLFGRSTSGRARHETDFKKVAHVKPCRRRRPGRPVRHIPWARQFPPCGAEEVLGGGLVLGRARVQRRSQSVDLRGGGRHEVVRAEKIGLHVSPQHRAGQEQLGRVRAVCRRGQPLCRQPDGEFPPIAAN